MHILSLQACLKRQKTITLNTESIFFIITNTHFLFYKCIKEKRQTATLSLKMRVHCLKRPEKASTQKVGSFGVDEMAFNNHRGDYYRVIPLHRLRCNGMVHVPSITELNGENVFTRARFRYVVTGDIKFSLHGT